MSETEIDPRQPDAYTENLIRLGQAENCIAQEDIYNEFGVLLIRKGTVIHDKAADQLMAHRLDKPIDDLIGLQKRLNGRNLFAVYQRLMTHQPDLGFLLSDENTAVLVRHLCMHRELHGGMAQKLTVMMRTRHAPFERTLAGAALAVLIGREAGLSPGVLTTLFEAAMLRDIALLHVSVKEGTPEWLQHQQIPSHALNSARLVGDSPYYPEDVVDLIRYHHERPDGLGEPAGVVTAGRTHLIALELADRAWSHLRQWFPTGPVPLISLVPWLRAQVRGAGAEVAQAFIRILTREPLPQPMPDMGDPEKLRVRLLQRALLVSQVFSLLTLLHDGLVKARSPMAETAQTLMGYVTESGFGNLESIELITEKGDMGMPAEEMLEVEMAQAVYLERAWRLAHRVRAQAGMPEDVLEVVTELTGLLDDADRRAWWSVAATEETV